MNNKVEKYLEGLNKPFDINWISTFQDFIRFLLKKPDTSKIVAAFYQEKLGNHKQFTGALAETVEALDHFWDTTENQSLDMKAYRENVIECKKFGLNSEQLKDPFFRAEVLCYNLNSELLKIIHQLFHRQKLPNIQGGYVLSMRRGVCEAKFVLPFSESLKNCELEADRLKGLREISKWGQWDRILELSDWVKNGITNDEFGQNIKNIFEKFQYMDSIRGIGMHILAELGTATNSKPVRGIEMYLDGSDNYWILIHRDKDELPKPYHIKRLYEGKARNLLRMLLKSSPNIEVNYEGKLTHDLGELHIKGELVKAFFPQRWKFSGAYVEFVTSGFPIDVDKILDELNHLQASRKKQTPFNRSEYFKSSTLHNKSF